MLERLDERGGGPLRDVPGNLVRRRGTAEDAAVGEPVLLVGFDHADVEEARLIRVIRGHRLDEQTRL